MNRGFAFYFKNAMKSSAATIWKNKGFLQVLTYFLAELVARATVIFGVIFALGDVTQAKLADENKRFSIPQSLKVATKIKPVWTYIMSVVAEFFIFLGGTLIIALITFALGLLGYAVCGLIHAPYFVAALFAVPGVLVFAVYALIMLLIFSPTAYVIETNPNFGVHETIKSCFDTMKSSGKASVFLNYFVFGLLEYVILGFCGFGGALIGFLAYSFLPAYLPVLLAVWLIISLAVVLLVLPMFELARRIALKSLFEDIVVDVNKHTNGINIRKCNGVKFKRSQIRETLVDLFDETETDSVPETDSPVRKKVKEAAARDAERYRKNHPEQPEEERVEAEQPSEEVVDEVEEVQTQPENGQSGESDEGFAEPYEAQADSGEGQTQQDETIIEI